MARKEGIEFKLVYLPPDFDIQATEIFDTALMTKLFELGYRTVVSGDPWQNHPPGYKH